MGQAGIPERALALRMISRVVRRASLAIILLAIASDAGAKPPVSRFFIPIHESVEHEIERAKTNKLMTVIQNKDETNSLDIRYRIPSKFSNVISHMVKNYDEYTSYYLIGPKGFLLAFSEDQHGSWGYRSGESLEIFVVDYPLDQRNPKLFKSSEYDYEYVIVDRRGVKSYRCLFDTSKISRWSSVQMTGPDDNYNPYPEAILKYLYDGGGMGKDRCEDLKGYIRRSEEDFKRRLKEMK